MTYHSFLNELQKYSPSRCQRGQWVIEGDDLRLVSESEAYNPFDFYLPKDGPHRQLAMLDIKKEESILGFVNQFGLLRNQPGQSLKNFREDAEKFQLYVNLISAINSNDTLAIAKLVDKNAKLVTAYIAGLTKLVYKKHRVDTWEGLSEVTKEFIDELLECQIAATELSKIAAEKSKTHMNKAIEAEYIGHSVIDERETEKADHFDEQNQALQELTKGYNDKLRTVATVLLLSFSREGTQSAWLGFVPSDNLVKPSWLFADLLQTLYIMVWLDLQDQRVSYRLCRNCKQPLIEGNPRKVYHSLCARAVAQKAFRRRKKIKIVLSKHGNNSPEHHQAITGYESWKKEIGFVEKKRSKKKGR